MSKRTPLQKYITPVGVARYPHLNKPDTRFDDEGVYKVDLIVDADVARPLIEKLEAIRDEKFGELGPAQRKQYRKADVYEPEYDDAGDETGNVIFRTKLNAIGRSKNTGETWDNSPKLFDSKGNSLPEDVQIWSGSKLIVAGKVMPYAMGSTKTVGVSLKCDGVQVIELVSGGGQTADSFGFGEVEGGFETDASRHGFVPQGDVDESSDEEDEDF